MALVVRVDERLELREGDGGGTLEQNGCVVVGELNAGAEVLEGAGELRDGDRGVPVGSGRSEESCPDFAGVVGALLDRS